VKIIKRASLVLLLAIFAHGVFTLGRQTEYNRMLWKTIVNSHEIKPVPKDEQKDLYKDMRLSFALPTKGDN